MKKSILLLTVLVLFLTIKAGTLTKIRSNAEAKNHRIVFEVEGLKGYKTDKKNDLVTITVFDCDLSSAASNVRINSKFILDFHVAKSGNSVKISFNLPKEFKVKTFKIDQPDRIVLDVSSNRNIQPPTIAEPASAKPNTLLVKKTKKGQTEEGKKIITIKSKKPVKILPVTQEKVITTPETNTLDLLKKSLFTKQFDKAITVSTSIIKERPATILAYYYRSTAYLEKGNLEKNQALKNKYYNNAVQDLNKVIIDSLSFTEGHAKIAEIYRLLGNQTKAEEHYAIFMGNFKEDNDSNSAAKTDAKTIIPPNNNISNDSLTEISFLGKSSISKLFLFIGASLVLVLIILLLIRKRINDKIYDEIEDVPSDEPDKDDLFENLRPKETTTPLTSSKVTDSTIKNKKSFMSKTSSVMDSKSGVSEANLTKTNTNVSGTILKENSEDDDYVSISLDENTRDRIIELYDDGYTNKEIAEQLKISYDEVNFIIRSLGEADNEKKNKNVDVQNSQAGGISESQNEEAKQMKEIQELFQQGVSIEELASYFKKPKDEIDFIVSLIEKSPTTEQPIKNQQSTTVSATESTDNANDEQLSYKIKNLAETGLSRKKIAEELKIGLDEVDFAASVFKIDFSEELESSVELPEPDAINHESVVDWTIDDVSKIKSEIAAESNISAIDNNKDEEADESMLISEALEHEKMMELNDNQQEKQDNEIAENVIHQDIVDEIINETPPIEEIITPISSAKHEDYLIPETQIKSSIPKILSKDEIGIDLDNFLTSRSINQDFGIAESRIFDFNKEEFKDAFSRLPSGDEELAEKEFNAIKNDLETIQSKPVADALNEDDFFLKKSTMRKQLAEEMKLEDIATDDVKNKFNTINEIIEQRINNQPSSDKIEPITTTSKKVRYNEPELSKSFEDIINDYDPATLDESTIEPDKDDEDLLMMREVYKRLDLGQEVETIAKDLEIGIDDVRIYKKIKDGSD